MAAAQGRGPGSEAAGPGGVNVFANDGSFLELFKRRMEEAAAAGGRSGPGAGKAGAEKQRETESRPEPPGEQEPPEKKRSGSALSFLPGSYNGCSLLSLHPGGQAERGQQASPEDRSGSQETKDRG
ncbi:telomerase RNA component interacting RNase isoform X2 [Podarcis muralis]